MSIFDRFFSRKPTAVDPQSLANEGVAPELHGITGWLNTDPLTLSSLRGRVVLVHFWTYSCVNCVRTLPAMTRWHDHYAASGLTIIGVHTPEFDFEKDTANVQSAIKRFGINFPVALDNGYATWNAYKNRYWPADYFIDANGNVRYHHFGEGGYEDAEAVLRALLAEAGYAPAASRGVAAPAELLHIGTPETYLGFERSEYLGSPESVRKDEPRRYSAAREPSSRIYYLNGLWSIHDGYATSAEADASIIYKVTSSTAHLVMEGPAKNAARVLITLDGKPLTAANRGNDVVVSASASQIEVRDGRLYDLFDLHGSTGTHLLRLDFLDPGVKCYAFTFG